MVARDYRSGFEAILSRSTLHYGIPGGCLAAKSREGHSRPVSAALHGHMPENLTFSHFGLSRHRKTIVPPDSIPGCK